MHFYTQATIRLPTEADNYGKASNLIEESLAEELGGYTLFKNLQGGWMNPDTGKVVTEPVNMWEVYTDLGDTTTIQYMQSLAEEIQEMTNEHTVMFTINNEALFVSGD